MPDASPGHRHVDHAAHRHGAEEHGAHHHETARADLLDLDAAVVGHLDALTAWAAGHAGAAPRTDVDVGAGTGTGTMALARPFSRPHACWPSTPRRRCSSTCGQPRSQVAR